MGSDQRKIMSNLFRKPLVYTRLSPGSFVMGRWLEGTPTDFPFMASVQATTSHDVQFLDIARRERKSYTLFTDTKLLTLTPGTANPDRVTINGEVFEVDVEAPWQNNVINHYKFIVTLMNAIEDTVAP
jgi:hypothetical protein